MAAGQAAWYFSFFLLSCEPTPLTCVQLGGSLAGKLSSELTTTSSSLRSMRSRSTSICCFGFFHRSLRNRAAACGRGLS
jgi:hypothetical protein